MTTASIRVPASTSNLGPGFDVLGIALDPANTTTVWRSDAPSPHEMTGEVAARFFPATGVVPFAFDWKIEGDVPRSRGLGSSVTVRLGLLHGLNELCGRPLAAQRIFEICADMEGHPDNAAPAAFGGLCVCGGGRVTRFEVAPELKFVLLIPDFEVSTPKARAVLPPTLDRLAAVRSAGLACRIVAAFATRDYEALRGAFDDEFHQPFREHLIPCLRPVIAAGTAAGALGGFLSGSGSTICCVTLTEAGAVASAMQTASGLPGARTVIATADNTGVRILA